MKHRMGIIWQVIMLIQDLTREDLLRCRALHRKNGLTMRRLPLKKWLTDLKTVNMQTVL